MEFIDTLEGAAAACAILRRQNVLALDMEGCRLGKHGQTSLLQLAASKDLVYIFDVLALGPKGLFSDEADLLAPILKSASIIKLCYDCRCDAEALYFLHGLLADGLYDLQIAYTLIFQASSDPYLKGLHRALAAPGVLPSKHHSSRVVVGDILRKKLETKRSCDFGVIMMQRPLPPSVLEYCATDVVHLFSMFALWSPRLGHVSTLLLLTKQRMLQFIHRGANHVWCMSRLDFACAFPAATMMTKKMPFGPLDFVVR